MNKLVSDFIEYLLSIGILAHDSLGKFKAYGDTKLNSNCDDIKKTFKNIMSDSLKNFIFSLDDNMRMLLVENIINKFFISIANKKTAQLKTAILIANAKKRTSSTLSFKRWYIKWKQMRINTQKYFSTVPSYENIFSKSFHERQSAFLKRKMTHVRKVSDDYERTMCLKCTFHPQINKTIKTHSSSPSYVRLFEDYKRRKNKYMQKQRDIDSQIKLDCSRNTFVINKSKIEELYNEYKKKQLYKKNLTKLIDIENGYTYQPFVPHDTYHRRVNTSFFERENEHMKNKEKLKIDTDKIFTHNIRRNQVGYERWSKMNKSELTQNVLERLYGANAICQDKSMKYKYNNIYMNTSITNIKQDTTNISTNTKSQLKNNYSFTNISSSINVDQ